MTARVPARRPIGAPGRLLFWVSGEGSRVDGDRSRCKIDWPLGG